MKNLQIPRTAEQLLAQLSRATNRSMACSVFAYDLIEALEYKEQEILKTWGIRIARSGEKYDFDKKSYFDLLTDPPAKKSGTERIAYAKENMPCVNYLIDCYREKGNIFEGIRIAAELIIEPKTAVLILALAELGAEISIACLASSADADVIEALKEAGVKVYANTTNSVEDDHLDSLKILDELRPHIILDDGAGLSRTLYLERPEYTEHMIGICEETTSGVWALEQMQEEGILNLPAIAVNDSDIKSMFDNLHGTGETVILTTISLLTNAYNADLDGNQMADTFNTDLDGNQMTDTFNSDLDGNRMADTFNADLDGNQMADTFNADLDGNKMAVDCPSIFSGKKVLLAGYGAVGSGIAKITRALGAEVIIAETNSIAALRALHDGYQVSSAITAVKSADFIISATGVRHTLTKEIIEESKEGATVIIAGGTYNEIALDDFLGNDFLNSSGVLKTENAIWDSTDKNICLLTLNSGKTIRVLTCGHGVNYTGGDGNPIEIMDLSFAGQFSALAYLIENKDKLPSALIRLPKEIAIDAAAIRLNSMGIETDAPKPPADWKITRYNNEFNS